MSNNNGKKRLYFQDSNIFDNLVINFSFQVLVCFPSGFFVPFIGFGVGEGDVGRVFFFHGSVD